VRGCMFDVNPTPDVRAGSGKLLTPASWVTRAEMRGIVEFCASLHRLYRECQIQSEKLWSARPWVTWIWTLISWILYNTMMYWIDFWISGSRIKNSNHSWQLAPDTRTHCPLLEATVWRVYMVTCGLHSVTLIRYCCYLLRHVQHGRPVS